MYLEMKSKYITIDCIIERSKSGRRYVATVNGKIIGSFITKFFAKRAIRKHIEYYYINGNRIWQQTILISNN